MKSTLGNMILSLGCISAAVGAILAGVNLLTAGPIEESARAASVEAVASVLPPFDNDPQAQAINIDGCEIYPASLNGQAAGAAVKVSTMDGFSGLITLMVGFDTSGCITGYSILEQAETPGLGAKAQEWFRDSTGHRSIIGSTAPLKVAKDGGEIDGITAATITSRAVLNAVNHAREAFNQYNSQS